VVGEAAVRSRGRIEISAPPEVVWNALTDFERWPDWNPQVKSISFDGAVAPSSEFRWKAGPVTIVSTLEQVEPPRFVRWRGRTMSIKAIHEWRLEPRDGGTMVETEETYSGLLARPFRGQLRKTLDQALEDGLEHLKREAERRRAASDTDSA
jgi:uncharacterized protein YndB with AHSA1/START domain